VSDGREGGRGERERRREGERGGGRERGETINGSCSLLEP